MIRVSLILCLAWTVGCVRTGTPPTPCEAIIAPAQEPKPPPEKRVGPFFPKRVLRAAFV